MSESRQREVARFKKEIADLQNKDAAEQKKEASKEKEGINSTRSISSSSSISSIRTTQSKLNRLNTELAKIAGNRADIAKKIADKTGLLYKAEQHLTREKEQERKKLENLEKRREQEQLSRQQKISNELKLQKHLTSTNSNIANKPEMKYDFFISHASEDKESFVRPLASELSKLGVKVWFDETTLRVGDSLRQKIDSGLSSSTYGIVVLSTAFFSKNWPQYELNGMVAKEMNGVKVILPIWHKVSKDEVLGYSPTLADKVALNTSISSVSDIAKELADVLLDDTNDENA